MKAIFLDRDGVINEMSKDKYVNKPGELRLIPGSAKFIKHFNDKGIKVIVVTNQGGVGLGHMSGDTLMKIHKEMENQLSLHGARLDDVYACTHKPTDKCKCRKPEIGMLEQAARDHGLDLSKCIMIGDSFSDIRAGKKAKVKKTILVLTGNGSSEWRKTNENTDALPDYIAGDLGSTIRWVEKHI